MGQILEFIMSNLFLIIIIISGLIGYINNPKKDEEKKKQQPKRRPVAPSPSPNDSFPKQQSYETGEAAQPNAIDTFEEQHQKQMEIYANSLDASATQNRDSQSYSRGETVSMLDESKGNKLDKERSDLRKRVRKDLRGKQLMNGIMMAEILGPPRAIKPYRSVTAERRRK